MNLLIEQRPLTISSKIQQQKSISNENDMNNSSSSSSSLVLKLKRHTNNLTNMINEDNQQTRSTNSSRLKRTIAANTNNSTGTATRRASSPAFNGKQQTTSKRSVTIDNNNNDLTASNDDNSSTKRFKSDELNSSNKVDASVETVSIGLATEPDQLGPCEPGTSVVLEGIVWNETDSGVLVVNVTWRGKTYVGTLLDSTKQDWACPRLICESPTSDYDPRHSSKTSRTKRANAGRYSSSAAATMALTSLNSTSIYNTSNDDRKLRNNIKSRQSKRNNPTLVEETATNHSSPLASPAPNNNNSVCPQQPKLIPCTEANCYKQFNSTIALNFHISDAHKKNDEKPIVSSTTTPATTTTITTTAATATITTTITTITNTNTPTTSTATASNHNNNQQQPLLPPSLPPPPPTQQQQQQTISASSTPSTRDEEDVAHILVNVAEYVRRSSPPPSTNATIVSKRNSPDQQNPSNLSWPCPQISSNLVLSSALNNIEQQTPNRSINANKNINQANIQETSVEHDDIKSSATNVQPADHFLLQIQQETKCSLPSSSPPLVGSYSNVSSWINNPKKDQNSSRKTNQLETDQSNSDVASNSTFVPIPSNINQQIPSKSASPAYSDISDEDLTSRNEHEQIPPSTINLLTGNHEKPEEHEQSFLSNPARWTTQMLLQQYGSYIQQQSFIGSNSKDMTTNRLNSKATSNGTSESMVKNILDARRLSTTKPSSPSSIVNESNDFSKNLYHYHNNGLTPETMINTLTSPNENLLKPTLNNPLDFSLNPNHCSSTLHSSR